MIQICVVNLQCQKRWLLVSSAFPHNEYQDTRVIFFFITSSVRQALLATHDIKYFTLVGAKVLQTILHNLLATALLVAFHSV